jgi:large subunit ribosomal protein L13
MGTFFPSHKNVAEKWYVVDADGQVLGRLAARVAALLRGKANPRFTPFIDTGEHVVVINAAKVRLTGQKLAEKQYHRFTGYPGGLKTRALKDRMASRPEEVLRDAVTGMLPRTKLGKQMARKLRIYRDDRHPHSAQKPEPVKLVKA